MTKDDLYREALSAYKTILMLTSKFSPNSREGEIYKDTQQNISRLELDKKMDIKRVI